MTNDAATIETAGLRVYPGAQSQVAIAYPAGGPRYGVTVARHTYKDGAGAWVRESEGADWKAVRAIPLTEADLAAIAAAPRHYLCG